MTMIYHESVELDENGNPPRGAYAPVGGIFYRSGSPEWRAARRKLKKLRPVKEQYKANAEAEARGEFVPVPGVFPVAMQLDMYEEGRWKSTFWQDLYEDFGD